MLEHLYLHETNEYTSNTKPCIPTRARTRMHKHRHVLEPYLAVKVGSPDRVRIDAPAILAAKQLQTVHNTKKAQDDTHILHPT